MKIGEVLFDSIDVIAVSVLVFHNMSNNKLMILASVVVNLGATHVGHWGLVQCNCSAGNKKNTQQNHMTRMTHQLITKRQAVQVKRGWQVARAQCLQTGTQSF